MSDSDKFVIHVRNLDAFTVHDQYFDSLPHAQSVAVALARDILQSPNLVATSDNTSITIKDEIDEVVASVTIHTVTSYTNSTFTSRRGFD